MSDSATGSKRGLSVVAAGVGINLALGILYSWSVISKSIPPDWKWTEAQKALPYTIACLVFAFMMVPAGRLQDKLGPRLIASIGGVLVGLGMIAASFFTSVAMFIVFFGVLAGTGIGFGYASATPPAIKWFPPAKTGMIAGIVVAGFGLASVYIAPLVVYLIGAMGLQKTMLVLGGVFMVVIIGLAQLLINPPQVAAPKPVAGAAPVSTGDFAPMELFKTPQFYFLWLMYAINSGAGLMVIGKLAIVVQTQAAFKAGFILVALLAIGNAGGRIIAGTFSDKLGRIRTLQIFTVLQAIMMIATPFVNSVAVLIVFSMIIGASYGANLAVFPSITKDFFGIKNFGVNYGLVFTSWGVGSLMALISGVIYDKTGSFKYAFFLACGLLGLSFLLSFIIKKPEKSA